MDAPIKSAHDEGFQLANAARTVHDDTVRSSPDGLTGGSIMPQCRMQFYTYILASKPNGTLYVGMTNDLIRRVWEHQTHATIGFTEAYGVTRLVWFEVHATAEEAIKREKRLKRYRRDWKIELIEAENPAWDDLYEKICR